MKRTHGQSNTREYHAWHDMIRRCSNPRYRDYMAYGGRGITVCQRWIDSFEFFLLDMGKRPDGLTLDRINNDMGYSPDNCRWATRKQQMRNQQIRNPLGKGVVHRTANSYCAQIKVEGTVIRLGHFKTAAAAAEAYDMAAVKYFGDDARLNGAQR
jgi:hypothetical protein